MINLFMYCIWFWTDKTFKLESLCPKPNETIILKISQSWNAKEYIGKIKCNYRISYGIQNSRNLCNNSLMIAQDQDKDSFKYLYICVIKMFKYLNNKVSFFVFHYKTFHLNLFYIKLCIFQIIFIFHSSAYLAKHVDMSVLPKPKPQDFLVFTAMGGI